MACNLASNKLIWSEVTSGEVNGGVDEATGIESGGVAILEFSRKNSSLLLMLLWWWLLLVAKFVGSFEFEFPATTNCC